MAPCEYCISHRFTPYAFCNALITHMTRSQFWMMSFGEFVSSAVSGSPCVVQNFGCSWPHFGDLSRAVELAWKPYLHALRAETMVDGLPRAFRWLVDTVT